MIRGRVIVLSAYAVPEPLPMIAPEGQPAGPSRSSLLSEQLGYRAPLYCDPVGNHKSNPVTIGSCARESPPQPNEVDSRTMESKIVPGLYFAGEILDLDGPIGGYNFQAAFSTGVLAGRSV